MGRAPCCDKANVKRGPWSPEEDAKLKEYIEKNGTGGNWIALPHKVGLRRCGKSCRLRWLNYLRPNIKHGEFSEEEDTIICNLFATIGSRWSIIAGQLPGRTDNDIKNYWNTKLKKKLFGNIMAHQSTQNYDQKLIRPNINQATDYQFPSANMPLSYDLYGNYSKFRALSRSVYDQSISPNFTPLISSNSKAAHDGIILSPFHGNYNRLDQNDSRNLIFGGDQASCSTSSGGSTYTSTSHQIIPDNYNNKYQDLCFQSYLTNGVDHEINQKFMFGTSEAAVNGWAFSKQNPLDYSIEEIKQLISTNNICNNNLNFSFVDHEIKTEEI